MGTWGAHRSVIDTVAEYTLEQGMNRMVIRVIPGSTRKRLMN
jgi:hypothetical protein